MEYRKTKVFNPILEVPGFQPGDERKFRYSGRQPRTLVWGGSTLVFAALIFLIGGCVPMQMTEESSVLHDKGIIPKQAMQQKDIEINKLKELLDDQQKQLRGLSDQLNECRNRK